MSILNCFDFDSSLKSVSDIYNLGCNEIIQFLNRKHSDIWCPGNGVGFYEYLLLEFDKNYPIKNAVDKVYWYHLTRIFDESPFREKGILPLNLALQEIYKFVKSSNHLAIEFSDWIGSISNQTLKSRLKDNNYGSFAMLVRETAFISGEMRNHNYLKAPESIEDLELHGLYTQKAKPAIIQFCAPPDRENSRLIKSVLAYLYDKVHGNELSTDDNTTFDAKGNTIKPCDILNIEYIE